LVGSSSSSMSGSTAAAGERDAAALAAGELRHLRFPGRQAQGVGAMSSWRSRL
jgi:hypothetical protein